MTDFVTAFSRDLDRLLAQWEERRLCDPFRSCDEMSGYDFVIVAVNEAAISAQNTPQEHVTHSRPAEHAEEITHRRPDPATTGSSASIGAIRGATAGASLAPGTNL